MVVKNVKVVGYRELQQFLGKGKRGLSDLKEPLTAAAAYTERQTQARFASEEDPDGKPWADLAPSTWARKRTDTILRETHTLVNSIHSVVSARVAFIQTFVFYAIFLQEGTSNMPARPFLGFSKQDEKQIAKFFTNYVVKFT